MTTIKFTENVEICGVKIPKGKYVLKKDWVELTPEEGAEIWADCHDIEWKRLVPPKEIIKRISDKLKEKNNV